MEKWVAPPGNGFEFVLNPWPIAWAYLLLGLLAVGGLLVAEWKVNAPRWVLLLPFAWLVWQFLASASSINPELSKATAAHFCAAALCFYIGVFCLADLRRAAWLLPGLLCGFLVVLVVGWQQHFGGLEQTRRYFFLYIYPTMKEVPPEYLKKLSSTRIFSTLFYPNALAGVILLLLPISLEFVWQARRRFTTGARAFLLAAIGIAAFACLYWSGSKGGWLLALVLGLIWLLRLPFDLRLKRAAVALVLVVGLAGFFVRYAGFFHKGATSVGARMDYWRAALQTAGAHPLFGNGPGTFASAYQKIKRPESEMTRLVHNDYLEQASDSGFPGLLLFGGWIVSALVLTAPRRTKDQGVETSGPGQGTTPRGSGSEALKDAIGSETQLKFALWLGVLGWALQSIMEFGLYLPALAWPAFSFLGILLGSSPRRAPAS